MFLLRFSTVLSHVDSAGVVVRGRVRETTDGRFNLVMEGVRGEWRLRAERCSAEQADTTRAGPSKGHVK